MSIFKKGNNDSFYRGYLDTDYLEACNKGDTMIKLFGTLLILLLSACGSNPSPDAIVPINTFTTVTASTQVSTAGMPYFQAYGCNDTTPVCPPIDTPIGQVVKQKMQINSLLCMNGTTDTALVYASIDSGTDTYILSQESQFEGYYVGPCVSNH